MSKSKKKVGVSKSKWLVLLGLFGLGVVMAILLRGNDVVLFNPRGLIADEQHRLMLTATIIMLGLAVPTLGLLYFIAWKYREGGGGAVVNHSARKSRFLALVFWSIPSIFVLVLASLMLPATQKLEPQRAIKTATKPLTIQVVALRWKWLFIYPEQNIATVNYVQIPVDTSVQFELTADDAPMNSFWIPHLGGQLYAMTGHQNRLNLMAETPGDYQGSAAEINGAGFAGMRFTTRASSRENFDNWVEKIKQFPGILDSVAYSKLLLPSKNNQTAFFSQTQADLYDTILLKYAGSHQHTGHR